MLQLLAVYTYGLNNRVGDECKNEKNHQLIGNFFFFTSEQKVVCIMELQTQNLPKKTFLKLVKMPNFKKKRL